MQAQVRQGARQRVGCAARPPPLDHLPPAHPQKSVYQDRLLKFFATVAAEASSEERVVCVEALLEALAELTCAKDTTPRWRACQLVHALLVSLPPSAAISDEVADAVQAALLERLEDSKPTVKAQAVRALSRLPDPGDAGDFSACPVTRALTDLLASEKSKEARKAVLASLPTSEFTKRAWLERTRDEADEVRLGFGWRGTARRCGCAQREGSMCSPCKMRMRRYMSCSCPCRCAPLCPLSAPRCAAWPTSRSPTRCLWAC